MCICVCLYVLGVGGLLQASEQSRDEENDSAPAPLQMERHFVRTEARWRTGRKGKLRQFFLIREEKSAL